MTIAAPELVDEQPTDRSPTGDAGRRSLLAVLTAHPLLVCVVLAVVARVALALLSFSVFDTPLVPDEEQYVQLAGTVADGGSAEDWVAGYGQSLYDSTWTFVAPLARLYSVFGTARIVGQLLAIAAGALTVALTYGAARLVVGRRGALIAALIVAVLPSQVFFSAAGVRESMVWAALAAIAFAILHGRSGATRPWLTSLVIVVVCLLALGRLRQQDVIVAAWAYVVAVPFAAQGRRLVQTGGALVVALLAPIAVGLGPGGYELVKLAIPSLGATRAYMSLEAESAFGPVTTLAPPTTVTTSAPTTQAGGADGPAGVGPAPTTTTTADAGSGAIAIAGRDTSTTIDENGNTVRVITGYQGEVYAVEESLGANLRAAPRGLLATLFSPLPWESASSASLLGAKIENLVWYGLYLVGAIGLLLGRRRLRVLAFPLLTSAGIVAVAALTQGNVGTAFRHRGQVAWAVAILAAAGVEEVLRRRAARVGEPVVTTVA